MGGWNGAKYQWQRNVKGRKYTVTCGRLGLPRDQWTKLGSFSAANAWFDKQVNQDKPFLETMLEQVGGLDALERIEEKAVGEATAAKNLISLALDTAKDPAEKDWNDALARGFVSALAPTTPGPVAGKTVEQGVDDFLALLRTKTKSPKTYQEIAQMMAVVKEWFGKESVASIDESKMADAYRRIAESQVAGNTKVKRWGFFKRFVKYLASLRLVARPANLDDGEFEFRREHKAVRKYPLEAVRAVLGKLPPKLRCWAILGLNCGMTNHDLGQLRKSMVVGGYLTRKREKTKNRLNAPTVTYKLWPETIRLMEQFRSAHADYWFTNEAGNPLTENKLVNGEPVLTDGVGYAWKLWAKRTGEQGISIAKFRNAAAQVLSEHEIYSGYGEFFLADVPTSIIERHYSNKNQVIFDKALDWLHDKLFPISH
jgi:integrase